MSEIKGITPATLYYGYADTFCRAEYRDAGAAMKIRGIGSCRYISRKTAVTATACWEVTGWHNGT